jgi:hypothetical protein
MTHKGEFTKVEKSSERMYGPTGILVCGYMAEDRGDFLELLDKTGLTGIRVVFATTHDLKTGVGELLSYENMAGLKGESAMPRAVVMSGLTQNELHGLLGAYREAGFVRQIWATVTPVSETWTLEQLLNELQAEDRAMQSKGKD